MSSLYGSIQGGRGEATRCGHGRLSGHVRGWHSGVRVEAYSDKENGDRFELYATAGSNGYHNDVLIGTLADGVFTPAGK